MRTVLYARVSNDARAKEGFSIPAQLRLLQEDSITCGDLVIAEVIDDFTGSVIERPGIVEVRQLAERGAFDVLRCFCPDRLARENYLGRGFMRWLSHRDIAVRFLSQTFDDTPEGELALGVNWEVAAYERKKTTQRTMGGRAQKAKGGRYPAGLAIFGYRQISKAEAQVLPEYRGRDGELLVIEEEAEIVQELFRRYAAGEGARSLCLWLNERGIRTRRGNLWQQPVLTFLLQNSAYVGRLYYGKIRHRMTEEVKPGRQRPTIRRKELPRDEWMEIPVPALVEESVFWAVQRRLEENVNAMRGRPSTAWPLQGVVFCDTCRGKRGEPLRCAGVRSSNAQNRPAYQYRAYVCASKARTDLTYCGVRCPAEKLEKLVHEALIRWLQPGQLAAWARAAAEARKAEAGDAAAVVRRLEKELRDLEGEERNLVGLYRKGLGGASVEAELTALARQRTDLSGRLHEARALLSGAPDPEEAALRAEALAEDLRARLAAAGDDAEQLQEIYRLVFRVYLTKDEEPLIRLRV